MSRANETHGVHANTSIAFFVGLYCGVQCAQQAAAQQPPSAAAPEGAPVRRRAARAIDLAEIICDRDAMRQLFSLAIVHNNLALAERLLEPPVNIRAPLMAPWDASITDLTPLFGAVSNGSAAMVELLIRHGARVDAEPFLIRAAIEEEKFDIIPLLLRHGAPVDRGAMDAAYSNIALPRAILSLLEQHHIGLE